MNLSTWQRIQQVFEAVVDLPAEERNRALERECGSDPSLRRRVESLILCEDGGELQNLVQGAAAAAIQQQEPDQIGQYRILQRLGEGGMGVVYEAEQLHPRRKVALKLMRSGHLASDREKRLFEREAEALGRLLHPGIATIFESGVSPTGQPFLVMEFIAGQTLSDFVAGSGKPTAYRRAELAPRIELFLEICEAITYAHQRGVIHRDLKPSNIMVSGGKVKVLDFGLARMTDEAGATRTETGIVQGSLRYMSPEQARGEAGRIDVRTDTYALGVILYEMISGQHPYLDKTDLLAAIQQICEAPVRSLRASGYAVDADLETILAKAMAKDPDQRYDSVAAFSGDLRRFLNREPILARPATIRYQIRMMVGRNRLAAGAIAALVVFILGFGAISFWQALRIRAERDRANHQAETAREVSSFLVNLFRETNPIQTNGVLTAKDLLISGRKRLETELKDKPEIRASLLDNIGSAFSVVGPVEESVRAYQESIRIRGEDALESSDSWSGLGVAYYNLGRYPEAVTASRKAVELVRKSRPASSPEVVNEVQLLASNLSAAGKYEEAAGHYAEIESLDERAGRQQEMAAIARLSGYGSLLRRMTRYSEAIEKLSLAARRMEAHPVQTDHLRTWNDLGTTLNLAGRPAEGEVFIRRAFEQTSKIYGETHPNLGILQLNLAFSLTAQSKWPQAEAAIAAAESLLRPALPENHPSWCDLWRVRAELENGQRQPASAARSLDRAYQLALASGGSTHPRTLQLEVLRLRQMLRMGQSREALPRLEKIISNLRPGSPDYIAATQALAEVRAARR